MPYAQHQKLIEHSSVYNWEFPLLPLVSYFLRFFLPPT